MHLRVHSLRSLCSLANFIPLQSLALQFLPAPTTTPAPVTGGQFLGPDDPLYLCGFPGNATRPLSPANACPFDQYTICVQVTDGSCAPFSSGVIGLYASIHISNSSTASLFSFKLYQDSLCKQQLFGTPTGEANLTLGQCASSALSGQTSFSFETKCPACVSTSQSCTLLFT